MIDLLLFIFLLFGFFVGLRRGFVLQLFHLTGFIIAFIFAIIYYDDLSPKLQLWLPYPDLSEGTTWAVFLESLPMEQAFYNGVSFVVLFFVVKIVLQILANMLDFLTNIPVLNTVKSLFGGVLGFIEHYFILFIVLYLAALLPIGTVQSYIEASFIAQFIIEHTPLLSKQFEQLWFDHVADHLANFSS